MISVSAHDLVVTRRDYPAIAQATFELPERHCALVTGPNGSGKTTLLKAIAGSTIAQRGEIRLTIRNQHVHYHDIRNVRRLVSYAGHSALYMRHITVHEHLALVHTLNIDAGDEHVNLALSPESALNKFHLEGRESVRVEDLSAGQQRRLHLASAFVRSTPLICIDEPHASLDDSSKKMIDDIIIEQHTAGRNFIIATHDPDRLASIATHNIALTNGIAQLVEHS